MLECILTSPQKTVVYKNLRRVVLPAWRGEMEVLSGHAEAFVSLRRGELVLEGERGREVLRIAGGESHLKDNRLVVIL